MARILLIDDDDAFRAMLNVAMVMAGHAVVEARNGVFGLGLFDGGQFDLVVTDIYMPDVEGLEVIFRCKRSGDVPIIAISGGAKTMGLPNPLTAAKALGASAILSKPFSTVDFLELVDRLLAERARAGEPT